MVVWTRKKCGWNSPNWLRAEPLAARGKRKRNEDFQVAGHHEAGKKPCDATESQPLDKRRLRAGKASLLVVDGFVARGAGM
ncbi:hypothetical protein V8C44DRAFT_337286 [Trichoderma aethiopicum]